MHTSTRTKSVARGLIALMIVGICSSGQTWPVLKCGPRTEPLVLTYVANTGVLVASGESKVLVDALFDSPNPECRAPSPDILDRIMNSAAPFDGVDLVLVTHNHPDHFDARLAVRYLENTPEPLLLAPADAVKQEGR